MTGGKNERAKTTDDILKYNTNNGTWELVGHMRAPRQGHGISIVNVEDLKSFCQS